MYENLPKNKKGQVIIPNEFPRIKVEDLLPGDIILFYYGNWATELHGRHRLKKLGRADNPPFHAAIFYEQPKWILDPELMTSFSVIYEYLKQSSKRIDIIRYDMTEKQLGMAAQTIEAIGMKEGKYDVKGYGAFVSQMPGFQWVKYLVKPSKKDFYCSDAVTYVLEEGAGIDVSPRDHNYTAPVDLLLYAMDHTGDKRHSGSYCTLYTLKQRNEVYTCPI
jgi:hypothetical protein